MRDAHAGGPKAIRMVFELSRADNHRLFDELSKFPKGPKRVNRLRVLAYDGLLAQNGVLSVGLPVPGGALGPTQNASKQPVHLTDQLFEPGLSQ